VFCHNSRVTDGQREFSSLDRVCIPYSAVKMAKLRQISMGAQALKHPRSRCLCIGCLRFTKFLRNHSYSILQHIKPFQATMLQHSHYVLYYKPLSQPTHKQLMFWF